jgi:hypothetical protein
VLQLNAAFFGVGLWMLQDRVPMSCIVVLFKQAVLEEGGELLDY